QCVNLTLEGAPYRRGEVARLQHPSCGRGLEIADGALCWRHDIGGLRRRLDWPPSLRTAGPLMVGLGAGLYPAPRWLHVARRFDDFLARIAVTEAQYQDGL